MPAFMASELPIRARIRHHWIVLFHKPSKVAAIVFVVLALAAIIDPSLMAVPFLVVLGSVVFFRWQKWSAELIILTGQRIVRTRGVPETTTSESSLRLDRISNATLEQTVLGKLLNYGTIDLDGRKLERIERPKEFYLKLRHAMFGNKDPELEQYPAEHTTAPLPIVQPPRPRWRR